MLDLFLDGMTIMMLLYFVALAGWLAKINIEERMSRGATFGQALRGIVKDLFSITRIG
jgi:hypothetical protein